MALISRSAASPVKSVFIIPREALAPSAVNWIELRQGSATPFLMPFVPAIKEPYIPPLMGGD